MNIQIHLATNVAAVRSHDQCLRDSKYSDFQKLFTYTVDEGMIKSGLNQLFARKAPPA